MDGQYPASSPVTEIKNQFYSIRPDRAGIRGGIVKRTPLRHRSPIGRTAAPRKRGKKHATEWARKYGSKARVAFVKSLPCAACGIVGYSENAHVMGNGGMSRKGDADTIAPLCGPRPLPISRGLYPGCHRLVDKGDLYVNGEALASATEAAWQAHVGAALAVPSEEA